MYPIFLKMACNKKAKSVIVLKQAGRIHSTKESNHQDAEFLVVSTKKLGRKLHVYKKKSTSEEKLMKENSYFSSIKKDLVTGFV